METPFYAKGTINLSKLDFKEEMLLFGLWGLHSINLSKLDFKVNNSMIFATFRKL